MIDYNTGDDFIRTHDFSAKEVYEMWAVEAEEFAKKKEKYHLY
jgi:uncharacterized protein YbbC (DUF1343 family)